MKEELLTRIAKHWNECIYKLYEPIKRQQIMLDKIPSEYFQENFSPAYNLQSTHYKTAMFFKYFIADIIETGNFNVAFNFSINNFEDPQRAWTISAILGLYASKGNMAPSGGLPEVFDKAKLYLQDPELLDYIDRAGMFYAVANNPLPEHVLTKTSLKDMLAKHEGRPVYIDFWASWCVPCREDIAKSKESKTYLEQKGVIYVYIANKDQENTLAHAVSKEGIAKNQYLLLDPDVSPLRKYLKVFEIPRYVLLNQKHEVLNSKAPGPNPESFGALKASMDKLFITEINF